MADFKTHITTSTVLGIAYGSGAHFALDVPMVPSMLAAGICSVSGMLPDLDSDSGIPVRETVSFCAALIPMLMLDRFQHMGLSTESMVLAGAIIYIIIRFGIAELFKRYTVHRGMWHSIPAALTATLLAFVICSSEDIRMRAFKAAAVFIGFMSHLILDELYSIDIRRVRIKRSFGTALKFWGNSTWGNISTYAKLVLLIFIAFGDPIMMESFGHLEEEVPHTANDFLQQIRRESETIWR